MKKMYISFFKNIINTDFFENGIYSGSMDFCTLEEATNYALLNGYIAIYPLDWDLLKK